MNNKIKYKLVDTAGQITAVVFDAIKRDNKAKVSNFLMSQNTAIEQVVFLENDSIQTMGNELCINGSFAGAYLSRAITLGLSGLDDPVSFVRSTSYISANFPKELVVRVEKNIVLLQGIIYLITNDKTKINKNYLRKLANKYNVPASGVVRFRSNKIIPIVYVKETNSLVWENACGSGSLAYSVYSKQTKITQPSNKIIIIKSDAKSFTIKVPVKIVE